MAVNSPGCSVYQDADQCTGCHWWWFSCASKLGVIGGGLVAHLNWAKINIMRTGFIIFSEPCRP